MNIRSTENKASTGDAQLCKNSVIALREHLVPDKEQLTANEKRLIAIAEDAERKYLHVQHLLTSFLGNMPALSFIKDDEGRYLYASKSFAEFFDVTPETFLGKTDHEWLPEDVARQFYANDEQVRLTGKPIEVIERVPKPSGVVESIVQKFPVWIEDDSTDNRRPFVGGIAIDVTARQQAEERALQLADDLENLAYTISHDLQEPVNTIKSYQNLLAVRYRDRLGADADNFINLCSDAAQTIDRMVTDLWSFARISRSKDFGNVDSSKALAAAIDQLSDIIVETGTKLRFDKLPKVRAVESQLTELFQQLIKNGIQSCSDGAPFIEITAVGQKGFEEFCISDNGCGIDPMVIKDIFKLFKRKGSQRPDASGVCMGLSISSRIVRHHNGSMRVESQLGKGSKFYFTLPSATC